MVYVTWTKKKGILLDAVILSKLLRSVLQTFILNKDRALWKDVKLKNNSVAFMKLVYLEKKNPCEMHEWLK